MQVNQLKSFDFEGTSLRVFGDTINPLFAVSDVCAALGISNPTMAVSKLADFEKTQIDIGQGPAINAVNESGLYTLILRSRDAVKEGTPAYRFRVKVTAEILPAIRRTGRYEYDNHTTINEAQQREIQRAVGKRAAKTKCFAAVYRALKNHFNIPRYTCLLAKDFEEAIAFIETCELQTPVAPEPEQPMDGRCPCCGLTPLPKDCVVLTADEAKALLTFIYYVRFVCSDAFERFHGMLRLMKSPLAGKIWDAFHEVPWTRILTILANNGYDIRDMDCYKHWLARKAA